VLLSASPDALHALRTWLDSWSGIGHVAVDMARQGFDLQLTRYDERGWRATFYTTGMEHSPTSATATAVLAGCENGRHRRPEIASTKRSGTTRPSEKRPVEKAGRRSTRRSMN